MENQVISGISGPVAIKLNVGYIISRLRLLKEVG